jgi:hypothetical protein
LARESRSFFSSVEKMCVADGSSKPRFGLRMLGPGSQATDRRSGDQGQKECYAPVKSYVARMSRDAGVGDGRRAEHGGGPPAVQSALKVAAPMMAHR